MKQAFYIVGGLLWLAFGAGFGLLLLNYLTSGAGMQDYLLFVPSFFSGSVLLGVVQVLGLFFLCAASVAIGAALVIRGLASGHHTSFENAGPPK